MEFDDGRPRRVADRMSFSSLFMWNVSSSRPADEAGSRPWSTVLMKRSVSKRFNGSIASLTEALGCVSHPRLEPAGWRAVDEKYPRFSIRVAPTAAYIGPETKGLPRAQRSGAGVGGPSRRRRVFRG